MRFLSTNLDSFLVELHDLPQTMALLRSLHQRLPTGVRELLPAARTIFVTFDPHQTNRDTLAADIAARSLDQAPQASGARVEIPVHYDGADLDEVARLLGMTRAEVIRRHTGANYTVAFIGFAPGFAYLAGGDPALNVPRRTVPRTHISAGSVALAGEFAAVYPHNSPGGWQLLGTTALAMWDVQRDPPALLQPGTRVRFVDAATLSRAQIQTLCAPSGQSAASRPTTQPIQAAQTPSINLHVESAGLLTLFQDEGRKGQAALGVSASGALDQTALRTANELVGNAPDAPCLEVHHGGLRLRCTGHAVCAVTGADMNITVTSVDDTHWTVARGQAFALGEGDVLALGAARAGVRAYVAVRGGFAIRPVLGSCASDTLAHLGPPALQRGDVLPVHTPPPKRAVACPVPPMADLPRARQCVTLDIVMGPRTDWFTPEASAQLCAQDWRVTEQSNRVGMRLAGDTPLARVHTQELPSEGTALGAIQVPPNGQPILFLADRPLTGGYPVIAAVASYHLDLAGQIPAGARIRFRVVRPFWSLHTETSSCPNASTPS